MFKTVGILGAGSWGMAVARLLARNDRRVILWEYDPNEYQHLVEQRGHEDKLPGVRLPDAIEVTNDLNEATGDVSLIALAIPSQYLRSVLKYAQIERGQAVVNLAKGIERKTLKRMSEVVVDALDMAPEFVTTLSGPSHAEEVAADMPTAVTVAGVNEQLVESVQETFSNPLFRVYKSRDIVGVELAGSLKNIIAIGSGIADGLGYGDNTRGALITRGLAEITRLGLSMGARPETFAGLSGLGDLITTCASRHSRNRRVGEQIGQGVPLREALAKMTMVAEGVETTRSGFELAELQRVEMPITEVVYRVLFEDLPAAEAMAELMGRSLKPEVWY